MVLLRPRHDPSRLFGLAAPEAAGGAERAEREAGLELIEREACGLGPLDGSPRDVTSTSDFDTVRSWSAPETSVGVPRGRGPRGSRALLWVVLRAAASGGCHPAGSTLRFLS